MMMCFGQDIEPSMKITPSLFGVDYDPIDDHRMNNILSNTSDKDGKRASIARTGDTPPVLSSFTWRNQGSCLANTNPDGSVTMYHPGAAGLGWNWCLLTTPLPAPPYTIISGYGGHIFGKAATLGHVLYDTTTNKFTVYSTGSSDSGAAALAAWRMTNFTTFNSIVYNFNNTMVTGGLLPKYIRIKDNGTYRTLAVSEFGNIWLTINVILNTDHMIPNEFAFGLRGTGDNTASLMNLHDLVITTP